MDDAKVAADAKVLRDLAFYAISISSNALIQSMGLFPWLVEILP
jgi:hypothetical protein